MAEHLKDAKVSHRICTPSVINAGARLEKLLMCAKNPL